jgi:Plant transposon protein
MDLGSDLDSDDDALDDGEIVIALQGITQAHSWVEQAVNSLLMKRKNQDHRVLPRRKKKQFDHSRALTCIKHDLTGPEALFVGQDFKMYFRISRSRFQEIMESFGNNGGPFYSGKTDCVGNQTASLEAKLLLPLQTLAFGVATHTFCLYFQMSKTLAAKSCFMFHKTFLKMYRKKYLKRPSPQDMVRIAALHEKVHGVPGMFGSLDCMHTRWKNCPVGWQGSYKGQKGYPSIVLEAVCDHHCFFWHLEYGHAGTNNDVNILHASDFYSSFLDGRFEELEKDVVPFTIGNQSFNKMFVLVDGAYPKFDRFVKPMKFPILPEQKRFKEWQAAARKDIERAFGILQGKFQAVVRPIQIWDINHVSTMVKCCLCLHNMCVSDRVMHGDFQADYDPTKDLFVEREVKQSALFHSLGRSCNEDLIGVARSLQVNPVVYDVVTRRERFMSTKDEAENSRLKEALISSFKY